MTAIITKPKGTTEIPGLILPPMTYSIRNNCQVGFWMQSDGETVIGKELSFCIVHIEQMYGDMGKTKGAHWVQLWGVSDQVLKGKVVFCTYIKGRSLNLLGNKVLEAAVEEKNRAELLFHSKFLAQSNEFGTHYILNFTTEDLPKNDIKRQQINDLLATNPLLLDTNIPPTLFATQGMDMEAQKGYLGEVRALRASKP